MPLAVWPRRVDDPEAWVTVGGSCASRSQVSAGAAELLREAGGALPHFVPVPIDGSQLWIRLDAFCSVGWVEANRGERFARLRQSRQACRPASGGRLAAPAATHRDIENVGDDRQP